jgi:serine/threonine-protein kinase HipA
VPANAESAGMPRLDVRLSTAAGEILIGTLLTRERALYFSYAPGFVEKPLPVSPFKLPVRAEVFQHTDREFGPVFGLFNDSLPDGWGMLLMDREFRKRGINPATLSPLDRLAYMGSRAMGALTFQPSTGPDEQRELSVELDEVALQAERILEGSAEEVLPELRLAGGSPGGARPKVVIAYREADGRVISGTGNTPSGFVPYLVKFGAREDPPEIGRVELAYWHMAQAAGMAVPGARLFETSDGSRYYGAERFDRGPDGKRVHMHTLGGLLHANHRLPSLDYDGFLRATRVLTRDQRQVDEAFRRMAFNVLAHNRDDHVKNFSYLMADNGDWTLSPAYDLVFSHGPGGEHTMSVAGEARNPTDEHMLRVAAAGDVHRTRARQMIDEVRAAVHRWPEFAAETGVPRALVQEIGSVIVPGTG